MRGHVSDEHMPSSGFKTKKALNLPFVLPRLCLNRLTLKAFNQFYFHLRKRNSLAQRVHYETFFYPLDHIQNWNRMYGPRGFYQYQCVVPRDVGDDAIQEMLQTIASFSEGSFLAVLKTFGARASLGMLSFPFEGVTLALDFPNKGQKTHRIFACLDKIVAEAKGRLYPAKDARMPRALFEAGYPRYAEFSKYRDPGMSSALSKRLMDE